MSATSTAGTEQREHWGSRWGFLMAAVGSAVGLGNMWRFAYIASEGGGAAFLLLYVILTFLVGVPVMIAEFALGRSAGLSPIGALRTRIGRGWALFGLLFIAAGGLILSYYSVIAGWVLRYAVDTLLSPWPADPGAYFGSIAAGPSAMVYQFIIMAVTVFIVAGGVGKGIERLSSIMMPVLFLILVALAIWATTLPGGGEGYRYYLQPRFDEVWSVRTLSYATSQAFFSLSLGMGAMLTFASYLRRDAHLVREATTISLADFSVAFVAGLIVFPVIAALALQSAVGESTVGALFISLPGAFHAMGAVGRVVGLLFFFALLIGAITSTVALIEVVVASIMDELKMKRRAATLTAGAVITIIGLWSAYDTNALGFLDALASEVFLPLGGLILAIAVGWFWKDAVQEAAAGSSPRTQRLLGGWLWTLRIAVPPLLVLVLSQTIPRAWTAFQLVMGNGG